jgi:hypothetical protein
MAPPQRTAAAAMIDSINSGRFPFWFPKAARNLAIDYFVYGTDFVPLGASADVTNNINIQGDSAFCILSAVLVETDTTNLIFLAQAPVQAALSDTGGGRQLSNQLIHVSNWFGTAQEPKYWDVPKILAPNATFSVRLVNLEATARNLRVAFHGFKIFGFAPA